MKQIGIIALLFFLSFILISLPLPSQALDFSQLKGTIDDEVIHLLETLPSDESYPDASVIVVLDEKVDEVQADGTCRSTLHEVFKVIKKGGEGYVSLRLM